MTTLTCRPAPRFLLCSPHPRPFAVITHTKGIRSAVSPRVCNLFENAIAASAVLLVGGLSYRAYVYATELPPGFARLAYADLQPAPGDPPTAVPETALQMDGHDVLLKGYMYPGKQQRGITQFLLVRDQGDCCFGGNPKITDRVLVTLVEPQSIDFTARLRKIAGRFAVRPTGTVVLEGGVIYHLENATVR